MKKYFLSAVLVFSVTFNLGIAHAATTPSLGVAGTFGILANTFERNGSPAPAITGDLGYATTITYGAGMATVSGASHVSDSVYSQAGTDLTAAATLLNNETCTYNFPAGSYDLATTDVGNGVGVYTPGVYCSTSSADASIGAAGITLSGSGTYVFKIKGALITASNSVVTLANGASACDVFWSTSSGSNVTTLGWNSTFVGTLIDPMQISTSDSVTMTGRMLVFGGTATPASDFIITVPTCATPPADDDSAGGGTDMCVNIAGDQMTVPNGYTMDAAGNCEESTSTGGTDMCVNIAGDQMTVPNGYTMDAAGNCEENTSTGETDMCTDAAGNQVPVPAGYTIDAAGNCVEEGTDTGDAASGHGLVQAPGTGTSPLVRFEEDVKTSFVQSENKFSDTSVNNICGVAAAELARRTVINGFPDGTFKNGELVNRAQAAKFLILSRIGNIENWKGSESTTLSDVIKGEWYARFVMQSVQLGVINGYPDLTFKPANPVNKAEFLKMLTLTFQLETNLPYNYSDVKSSDWFAKYAGIVEKYDLFPSDVQACSGARVAVADLNGDGVPDALNPGEELSRADVAVAIYQYLKNRTPSPSTTQSFCFQNHNCVPIIVYKHANPQSHQVFTFNANFFGNPISFNLDDDVSLTSPSSLPNWLVFPVSPGSYTVSEVPVAGYNTDITYVSQALFTTYYGTTTVNMTVAPNDYGSFVDFENTRTKGTLKVIKKVVPTNDPTAFTFHLGSFGGIIPTGYPATFQLDDNTNATLSNTATFSLDNNVQSNALWLLGEDAVPGYTTTLTCVDASGGSFTVSPPWTTAAGNAFIDISGSETVTCTFTNTKKKVLPTTATSLEGPLDALFLEGEGLESPNGQVGHIDLNPCVFAESNCGHLVIIKDTVPDSNQSFVFQTNFSSDFTLDDDGGVATPFTTTPNQKTFDLAAGAYTVHELGTTGYTTSSISCVDHLGRPVKDTTTNVPMSLAQITLPANETVTCTFVNKPVPTPTACFEYTPNVTACGVGVQINRTEGAPTYKVKVNPTAVLPTVNPAPSTSAECVNTPGSPLQTTCAMYYSAYPTALTFTATSSAGSLPVGAIWSGGTCSGSASTPCSATLYQGVPIYVIVTIP